MVNTMQLDLLTEYSRDLKNQNFYLFITFIHDFIPKVMSKENNIFKKRWERFILNYNLPGFFTHKTFSPPKTVGNLDFLLF